MLRSGNGALPDGERESTGPAGTQNKTVVSSLNVDPPTGQCGKVQSLSVGKNLGIFPPQLAEKKWATAWAFSDCWLLFKYQQVINLDVLSVFPNTLSFNPVLLA